MGSFDCKSKFYALQICTYYLAQHICLHELARTRKVLTGKQGLFQERDCTADHCPLLHCRKDEERTAPKILCKKSFSTSTDGFRRHGASREAALDSKMLLKAVLIVCVVRKERKSKRLARRVRLLFPRIAAGTLRLPASKAGRREPRALASFVCTKQPRVLLDSHRFFGPRSYDASGEVGGYLVQTIGSVLLILN